MKHGRYRRSSESIFHETVRITEMGSELYAGNKVRKRKLSSKYYQPIIQIQDLINRCYECETII